MTHVKTPCQAVHCHLQLWWATACTPARFMVWLACFVSAVILPEVSAVFKANVQLGHGLGNKH